MQTAESISLNINKSSEHLTHINGRLCYLYINVRLSHTEKPTKIPKTCARLTLELLR